MSDIVGIIIATISIGLYLGITILALHYRNAYNETLAELMIEIQKSKKAKAPK